ncbi:MAG: response regulator [Chloroflexi bacterium]|nr:response regulator [Chloroflexota bacterium]
MWQVKKVLIADDEQPLRLLLRATLSSDAYQILEAEDGKETLALAQKEQPDILLLDVLMPGLDGFEVCERLKKDPATAGITVVMLTAKGQETDKERGKRVGADYYLTKPFSPIQLLQLMNDILGI